MLFVSLNVQLSHSMISKESLVLKWSVAVSIIENDLLSQKDFVAIATRTYAQKEEMERTA